MLGERIDGARLCWRHWFGGPTPSSLPRTCIGAVEHVARGWIIIRRPRATAPVLKRLTAAAVASGRLSAVLADGSDILRRWVAEDEADRQEQARRKESRARGASASAPDADMADNQAGPAGVPSATSEGDYFLLEEDWHRLAAPPPGA